MKVLSDELDDEMIARLAELDGMLRQGKMPASTTEDDAAIRLLQDVRRCYQQIMHSPTSVENAGKVLDSPNLQFSPSFLSRLYHAVAFGQQADLGDGHGEVLKDNAKLHKVLEEILKLQIGLDTSTFTKLIAGNVHDIKTSLGRFQDLELIGTGGFGMVYRAFDPLLKRWIALKLPYRNASFMPQLAGNIFKEAQTNAQFDHPNIVPVYEAGEIDGVNYLALGLCTGPSLAQWLANQDTPVPIRRAVTIVKEIASALACSHRQGIVHRDVKPANILLFPKINASKDDFAYTAKLTDFGLSKIAELSFLQSRSSIIVGTPAYIAPEQVTHGIGKSHRPLLRYLLPGCSSV